MKKAFAWLLILLLVIPVSAAVNPVQDGEDLLTQTQLQQLQEYYVTIQSYGFTPILVTTPSFAGMSAEDYAADFYDSRGCPENGILYLVSLTEGEWYILTNGLAHTYISDRQVQELGDTLAEDLRRGDYYGAFRRFPELAAYYYGQGAEDSSPQPKKYGKTIAISMGAGMLVGLAAVGIMAYGMKSVRSKPGASDYVRPGSMHLTNSRDIFLYSHVTRTPRPKNTGSGGGGGSRGGGRGGAGGRI